VGVMKNGRFGGWHVAALGRSLPQKFVSHCGMEPRVGLCNLSFFCVFFIDFDLWNTTVRAATEAAPTKDKSRPRLPMDGR
jgi:hypothetical protein